MEPVCVINNITIATADDITTLCDDVNIYPVDLSGTINTLSNALNWLEKKQLFQANIFFNLFSVILGTHLWPLSVPELTVSPTCIPAPPYHFVFCGGGWAGAVRFTACQDYFTHFELSQS